MRKRLPVFQFVTPDLLRQSQEMKDIVVDTVNSIKGFLSLVNFLQRLSFGYKGFHRRM